MKKTIICSIPMKKIVDKSVYESDDLSVEVSATAVRYPINAYLEKMYLVKMRSKLFCL